EEEPLPFALGFVHVRLDFHEIENDDTLGIQQPHLVVRSHGPDPDVLERRKRGAASFIELELEAACARIELEGNRASLVARGVGNFPRADHLLGGVARRRRLRAGADGGQRKRDHGETSTGGHGEIRLGDGCTHAITPRAPRHASPAPRRTALHHLHMRNLRGLVPVATVSATTTVHGRFCAFGGHGVSGTGVSGGLPAAQAKRLSTTSWSILSGVATDAEPRWGNNTTLSIAMSSAGTSGSRAKTSRPADRMVFCCSALISAGSSTTEPRDMLMRMPSGPSAASTSPFVRFLVSPPP